MGAGTAFCKKGKLGETCNGYDAYWKFDYTAKDNSSCIELCESNHFMKTHLMDAKTLEEEILTGGATIGHGDAFFMMPGGIGTSRELFDVLQANFEYDNVNKPIFCLNLDGGFYDGVVSWLKHLFATNLLKPYPGSKGSSFFISEDAAVLAAAVDKWAATGSLPEELRLENILNKPTPAPTPAPAGQARCCYDGGCGGTDCDEPSDSCSASVADCKGCGGTFCPAADVLV